MDSDWFEPAALHHSSDAEQYNPPTACVSQPGLHQHLQETAHVADQPFARYVILWPALNVKRYSIMRSSSVSRKYFSSGERHVYRDSKNCKCIHIGSVEVCKRAEKHLRSVWFYTGHCWKDHESTARKNRSTIWNGVHVWQKGESLMRVFCFFRAVQMTTTSSIV